MCIAAAQRKPQAFDSTTQHTLAAYRQTKQAFDQLNAQLDGEASVPCRGKTAWWEVQPLEEDAVLHCGVGMRQCRCQQAEHDWMEASAQWLPVVVKL
jgi:hypothetical protein